MTDMLALIRRRRSIRKYGKKALPQTLVRKLLEAGRWAPSGLNNQPWRFLVIKDKRGLCGLATFTQYGPVIQNAGAAIVVCMDIADSYNREKDLMAIGACIENMLLEATSLGLGCCWLGEILNKKEGVSKFLGLDEDIELMAVITVGYPRKLKKKGSRKPLDELIIGASPKV